MRPAELCNSAVELELEVTSRNSSELQEARWFTQHDFLRLCAELAPAGIPTDHPSRLASLFTHSNNEAIPADTLFDELGAAIDGAEAIKSNATPIAPIQCLREAPLNSPPVHSKLKIGILVVHVAHSEAGELNTMYTRSLHDKQEYAAKHGYEVIIIGKMPLHKGRPSYYGKWMGALSHLRRFDWVWMVDLDTLIMNPQIPLEAFVDPRYDVVMTADCNGFNAGSQFIRNSTWSFMFLAAVYMHNGEGISNGPEPWRTWWGWNPDQTVVWKLFDQHQIRNHVKVPPQRLFNSFAGQDCLPEGTFQEGDFLVHFAGGGKPMFNEYWNRRPTP